MNREESKVVFWSVKDSGYDESIFTSIKNNHADASIICLTGITATCCDLLSSFSNIYHIAEYDCAIIVQSKINVVAHGCEELELCPKTSCVKALQWLIYESHGKSYLVAHIHGVEIEEAYNQDHELRHKQSHLILRALAILSYTHNFEAIIFGGKLNLDLETSALKTLEGSLAYRNLIKEFAVTTTKTDRFVSSSNAEGSVLDDYVLVSRDLDVTSFEVLNEVDVSDNAPLAVAF